MSRNVVLLGITSLFTDLSTEMVSAVLPIYLTVELKLTFVEFGAFDGLCQAVTAPVRIAGGILADRYRRYKTIASLGYGLSALCKIELLAASNAWGFLMALLFLDRLGKGVRTAPRDALIALHSSRQMRAEAFGVHRTFDTIGALLGPLAAFSLLGLIPYGFDAVFVVSFCFAVVGTGVIAFFVQNESQHDALAPPSMAVSLRSTMELSRTPLFGALLTVSTLLSAATISDAFVYLTLQHRSSLGGHLFPLLYLGTALATLLLAVPMGRIADRLGRGQVFLGGYALLGAVYGVLLLPTLGPIEAICCVALFGAYYAATDGVLMAIAGNLVPQELLTSGLACLTTATVLARFLSSLLFGSLWAWGGPEWAVVVFGAGLLVALAFSLRLFVRRPELARA